jgi:hypothetical protein
MALMPDPDVLHQLRRDGAAVRAAERVVAAELARLCPCGGDSKGGEGCTCDPPFSHTRG